MGGFLEPIIAAVRQLSRASGGNVGPKFFGTSGANTVARQSRRVFIRRGRIKVTPIRVYAHPISYRYINGGGCR
jgi:hypothetical protein